MSTHSALLDTLRQAVGAAHVLIDGDLTAYEQDWRQRARGRALAVVRPGSTDEVAAVVNDTPPTTLLAVWIPWLIPSSFTCHP